MTYDEKKLAKVKQLIGDSTHFVSVTFIKKDGEPRTITFNKRARKGIKDPDSVSEAARKALETHNTRYPNHIRVLDSQLVAQGNPVEKSWRMINSDTVIQIDADGVVSKFKR